MHPRTMHLAEAVDDHVAQHVGPFEHVVRDDTASSVHVDIRVVAPSPDRPYLTLVTSGMSEQPMTAAPGYQYAELVLTLPPTWDLATDPWPLDVLEGIAELPHRLGTGLWVGHCVPHGEPYTADTGLSCAMLLPPLLVPVEFETLDVGDREIRFLAVFLLHSAELQYKLDHGTDALLDLLDAAGLTEAVKLERPSVVPRRRRLFGLR